MSGNPFDLARSAFVKMDDLEGRLLLITPTASGERESTLPNSNGKLYTFVVTDTAVLDGEPSDMIASVPMVLEDFQFSGMAITAQLLPKIKTGVPLLGRLGKKESQTKGFGKAWILEDPTEDDVAVGLKYWDDTEEQRKAEEARRAAAPAKSNPFA